jgi:hypothetical protein
VAVTVDTPRGRLLVEILMTDDPLRDAVPSSVVPIMIFTEPDVGTPVEFGEVKLTVAVNVTFWPRTDGFGEDASLTRVPAGLTPCCSALETLAAELASPL